MPNLEGGEGTMLPKAQQRAKGAVGGRDMGGRAAAVKTVWQSAIIKQVPKALGNIQMVQLPWPCGP